MNTDQLKVHHSSIGGTRATIITLGQQYGITRLDLFLQLKGKQEPPDLSGVQRVRMGQAMEQAIAEVAAERMGWRLKNVHRTIYHKNHHFLTAHPDRQVFAQEYRRRFVGLEIKNRDSWQTKHYGDEFTDQVQASELIQCHHYMNVTGASEWWLAVLFGGVDLRIYHLMRNQALIDEIEEKCIQFWADVEMDIPPMPISHADMNYLYRSNNGSIELGDEHREHAIQLQNLHEQARVVNKKLNDSELWLKSVMQENSTARLNGKVIATWNSQKQSRFDQKKFKEDHPETAKKYTEQSTIRKLLVK